VIHLFEDWLRPHLDSGALEAILEPWWRPFTGPFLYYPSRKYMPAPLRAFIDFIARDEMPVDRDPGWQSPESEQNP
jgi:DNA-binding transcriptional LysR family regulator